LNHHYSSNYPSLTLPDALGREKEKTFFSWKGGFKASPIIKAAPFPSLVGEGQGGVRGEVWRGVCLYIKNFSNILLGG
jgi:hypothetical protein